MADTYTTRNRLTKPEVGAHTNAWGGVLNSQNFDMVDALADGKIAYTLSGTKTLTSANGSTDEARMRCQHITGGTGGTVTIPAVEKAYFVINQASASVYFTCGGVSAEVPTSSNYWVYCNGTDCFAQAPITYSAALTANYAATSSTSLLIGAGSKSLTITAGKVYQAGDYVKISSTVSPTTKWMWGTVTSYNSSTGAMVASITEFGTVDTLASWNVSLSGSQGTPGDTLPALGTGYSILTQNAGGSATAWVAGGHQTIQTYSPSAVATYSITGLLAAAGILGYQDLVLEYDLTQSISGDIFIGVSDDAVTYRTVTNASGAGATTHNGVAHIPGFRNRRGIGFGAGGTASAPTGLSPATNTGGGWLFSTGVDAIRFTASTGTLSGTIVLKAKNR